LSDNSEHVAEVVKRDVDFDLAILKIDVSNLPVVIWDKSSIPARGKWLATTDLDRTPSAVGVVSAGAQRVGKAKAVLGVHLIDSSEGAAITMVLPGSGADEAGLQIGDSIYAVEGREVYSRNAFLAAIDGRQGGQPVKLSVNRASRKFDIDARLMDLADELLDETEMEVNGRISARATGFSRVFLHDTVLEPNQCGGPLCNLDGLVVGLNIARAGRVTSYALPADVVQPIIQSMIEQAQLVSRPVEAITTQTIR
jgi:serine protease Do